MAIVALVPLAVKFLASFSARTAAKKVLQEALKKYAKSKTKPPKDLKEKITETIKTQREKLSKGSRKGKVEGGGKFSQKTSNRDAYGRLDGKSPTKNVIPKTKTKVGEIPLKVDKGKFSRKNTKTRTLTKGFKKDNRKKQGVAKTNAPGFAGRPPKSVGGGAEGLKKAKPKLSLLEKAKRNKAKILGATVTTAGVIGSGVAIYKGIKKPTSTKKTNGVNKNTGSDNRHMRSNVLNKKRNVLGKRGGINVERKIGPRRRK